MKRFLALLLVLTSLTWFVWDRIDRFSPSQIEAPLFSPSAPILTPVGKNALSQTYHYLNKGRQCFVFESEDKKYVLKFFNKKYLKVPWYAIFPYIREKEILKRERRQHFYLNSYEIAFREFGEEILYLHLGPANEVLPILHAFDKRGYSLKLDLNLLPFVLQRRGDLIYDGLISIYEKEGERGVRLEIDRFVEAIATRIEKRIADTDHDVEHNWGFVDGKLFHLDPGRLYLDESLSSHERQKTEWWSSTHRFRDWLEKFNPELALYLDQKISAKMY